MASHSKDDTSFLIPAQSVMKVFSRLRKEHGDMSLVQAMVFFHIAAEPGITQRKLWGEIGTADSVASRAVAILGSHGMKNASGNKTKPLNLIEVKENPDDRRERLLFLTSKGRMLMQDIINDLGLGTGRGSSRSRS